MNDLRPKQIISRTVIDKFIYHPKGIIGRTLINLEGKNIIFDFEWKILDKDFIQILFFKNGNMFFSRNIANGCISDNVNMLTDEECLLLSFLVLGVIKVLEKYEKELESDYAEDFVRKELAMFEMDILPEKEADQDDLISVLRDSPINKM